MNVHEIKIPTLQQLQELFPLGVLDLDLEARREVNAIFAFRNIFVRMTDPDALSHTADLLETIMEGLAQKERTRLGFAPDDMSEESRHVSLNATQVYSAQFLAIAQEMQTGASATPGLRLAGVDNQCVIEKEAGEIMRERGFPASGRVGSVMAQILGASPMPLPLVQCMMHAGLHGMFRDIVHGHLYRQHPGIRFPFHRLVVINVDVPEEATVLQATITGYQIPLLRSMQPKTLPDVLDSSMFEKKEPGFGRIMQDPGHQPKPEDPK